MTMHTESTAYGDRVCRVVAPEAVVPLRAEVLRPGLPHEASVYGEDQDPGTIHAAAFTPGGETPIGVVTLFVQALHQAPVPVDCPEVLPAAAHGLPIRRIRGSAVDPSWRGQGVGKLLQRFAVEQAKALDAGPCWLWANARIGAVPFYEKLGWRVVSELFEIPDIGPHRVMVKPPAG